MITTANYYEQIKQIKKADLPEALQKSWDFVDKVTLNGSSWDAYNHSDSIKKTVDLYLSKLNEFVGSDKKSEPVQSKRKSGRNTDDAPESFKKELRKLSLIHLGYDIVDQLEPYDRKMYAKSYTPKQLLEYFSSINFVELIVPLDNKAKRTASKSTSTKAKTRKITTKGPNNKAKENSKAERVEHISEELKFMKRFVNMHDKVKNRNQIRLFINALQKAIRERRITKDSKYAKEIMEIQDSLIKFHAGFKSDLQKEVVTFSEKTRSKFLTLIGRQIELLSVKFIKSYINLQGKVIQNEKAKNLHNRIANAINNERLTDKDKYWKEVENILEHLKTFIQKNPNQGILRIEERSLNGLEGILGCPCELDLKGIESNNISTDVIMSSEDIIKLKFDSLGFKGKWLEFIGDPVKGFTAMIFGKPKFGKSILAIKFANYLARNFGNVLYIASEEQIGATLQQKLIDGKTWHPDLFFTGSIPQYFDGFDFVFIDSVNNYGLSVEQLENLKRKNPNISFIYIFQTTKQGNFRGSNEFQHNVDVVVEVPEKGKAVQFGRFNQGGTMNIFS